MTYTHFYMVPFTGLGLFGGYRGDQWLKNRIKVFEEFVLTSLTLQTRAIVVWFCWRKEDAENPIVQSFAERLKQVRELTCVHTYAGIPFWDDKYGDKEAEERLRNTLAASLPKLREYIDSEYVLLTTQPSDDIHFSDNSEKLQDLADSLLPTERCAIGWKTGYVMNYATKEIAEYTTTDWVEDAESTYHTDTIPPFFTILFTKEAFLDPERHYTHIGPYKSHEYIADMMPYHQLPGRGFIVGCHGENISTTFNHRYKGRTLTKREHEEALIRAGIFFTDPLQFKPSARLRVRRFINKVPFRNALKTLYYKLPTKLRII